MTLEIKWQNYDGSELKPGMLIKWKSGEVSLIGDVNPLLGVCDDCTTDKCDFTAENEFYKKADELYKSGDLDAYRKYNPHIEWLKSQIDKVYYLPLPEDILSEL